MKTATHMVAGLGLITAAIVQWNRVHLDRAVGQFDA
jgi:TnpA family transposase